MNSQSIYMDSLNLLHLNNHTPVNRICDIHKNHNDFVKDLQYTIGKPIYNMDAGLYKIIFDGIEYIIDVYFKLTESNFLMINSKYDITIYVAGNPYPVIPYKINSTNNGSSYEINTVNSDIDTVVISGAEKRIEYLTFRSQHGSDNDIVEIPLKYSLGKLKNGLTDYFIINTAQQTAHIILNTYKEMLTNGLDYNYVEELSDRVEANTKDYYIFFINRQIIKISGDIYCTDFKPTTYNKLISNETITENYIATGTYLNNNGIWLKIKKSLFNITDKELEYNGTDIIVNRFRKWIKGRMQSNPIYVEYELSNTIFSTILIDDYHIKTWYPNTTISLENNYDFSIFYKSLKSGGENNALE